MSKRRLPFRPQLEVLEDRLCPSGSPVQLPISAFLSQQGTTMMFTPPVPDQIGATNSAADPGTTNDPNRFILVDYTGQAATYLLKHGINLHTQVTGLVTETPLGASGVMEVTVNLEATNALTWVANIASIYANPASPPNAYDSVPLELGYRAQDLVANPSLKPALSDVHFQITFQEQTGAPLPDLVQALTLGNIPPGFSLESIDLQSWGTGVLDAGTTVGAAGQNALVFTSQIYNATLPNLPGTQPAPDGTFQEPIDIVPFTGAPSPIAYLNGTLFINDLSNGNDNISVSPASGGGATVSSNLGSKTFAPVSTVVVTLGGGNSNVQVASLSGATVNVAALDGNNNITIGNEAEVVVSVGGGNDTITTGNVGLAQEFFVVGNGNTNISAGAGDSVILVAGNGNHNITVGAGALDAIEVVGNGNIIITADGASDSIEVLGNGNINITAGASINDINFIVVVGNGNHNIGADGNGDSIEVLGNGNNTIQDTGINDIIMLGGNGNNNIDNEHSGSYTVLLYGTDNNNIRGNFGSSLPS